MPENRDYKDYLKKASERRDAIRREYNSSPSSATRERLSKKYKISLQRLSQILSSTT